MWKRNLSVLIVFLFLSAMLVSLTGCDTEQVIEQSEKLSDVAEKLAGAAPPPLSLILTAIASVAAAVGASAGAISQFRKARNMRKAILAKADQIDDLLARTEVHNPPNEPDVRAFMKADKMVAKGAKKKALQRFDNIRKDLV